MNIVKKLKVGDIIECRGIKVKIAKILSQDAFIPKKDVILKPRIDIEFEDTNGKYRRWRSDLDGGFIHYASTDIINSVRNGILAEFYESSLGLFNIPLSSINSSISDEIIKLLKNGYGLAYNKDEYSFYTVFSLNDSCARYRKILKCRELIQDFLQSEGYNYMEYISIEEYVEDIELQTIVDRILLTSNSYREKFDGWSVVLTINKGNFMFAEVLNAFA